MLLDLKIVTILVEQPHQVWGQDPVSAIVKFWTSERVTVWRGKGLILQI